MEEKTVILNPHKIKQKLMRMAYEIIEENYGEPMVILAGINNSGLFVAKQLKRILTKISDMPVTVLPLKVYAKEPNKHPVEVNVDEKINDKVVIIVDDVANTGRTLLFAVKPFLTYLPKKIQMAVLVDRKHKQYPVACDFVGLSLSTTIHEHIKVEVQNGAFKSVYLN
jgi:pyrimidine operon attenuation protein / uracil phosphoribosyltransferase